MDTQTILEITDESSELRRQDFNGDKMKGEGRAQK